MAILRRAMVLIVLWCLPVLARDLSLDEAVRLGEANVATLRSRQADIERAEYLHKSLLATFGPRVVATAGYQHWDRVLGFETALLDANGAPTGAVVQNVVRRQDTYSLGLSVQQPLTPLLTTWLSSRISALGVDQASLAEARDRTWVRHRVVEAYYLAIAAERNLENFTAMERTVAAHLHQVEEFVNFKILKRDDLLRTQVQFTSVQRERTAAEASVKLAQAGLAVLIGDPLTTAYTLRMEDASAPVEQSPEACEEVALRERADLKAARAAVEGTRKARDVRYMDWVPQIGALFAYNRSSETTLASADAWYIGVNLDWTLWEWGRSYYALKASNAEVRRAEEAVREVENGVRLEVRQAWLAVWRASADIERTRQAAVLARENLDIQLAMFREKLNTTTAVLDAQSLVMEAETVAVVAATNLRIAAHQLATAMGR
jgi:outer membrane protein